MAAAAESFVEVPSAAVALPSSVQVLRCVLVVLTGVRLTFFFVGGLQGGYDPVQEAHTILVETKRIASDYPLPVFEAEDGISAAMQQKLVRLAREQALTTGVLFAGTLRSFFF